jgi:hypothetical protein
MVLNTLYEAKLIGGIKQEDDGLSESMDAIVSLKGAHLMEAYLYLAHLEGAHLEGSCIIPLYTLCGSYVASVQRAVTSA